MDGIADEERLRAWRHGRGHGVGIELPGVLFARPHRDRGAAREDDRRQVGDVGRVREDDLVTGVDDRRHRRHERLGRPDRDDDLALGVVAHAVQPLEMGRERGPELDRAVVARVVGATLAQRPDAGLDDRRGRVEVGLAHAEADDVGHRVEDVEEAPDARWRDLANALRQALAGHDGGGRGRHGAGLVCMGVRV